jgi:hypothetical protein
MTDRFNNGDKSNDLNEPKRLANYADLKVAISKGFQKK